MRDDIRLSGSIGGREANIGTVSDPWAKRNAPELALTLVWVGACVLLVVEVHPLPLALASCVGVMFVASGISRQIRAVRKIAKKHQK